MKGYSALRLLFLSLGLQGILRLTSACLAKDAEFPMPSFPYGHFCFHLFSPLGVALRDAVRLLLSLALREAVLLLLSPALREEVLLLLSLALRVAVLLLLSLALRDVVLLMLSRSRQDAMRSVYIWRW